MNLTLKYVLKFFISCIVGNLLATSLQSFNHIILNKWDGSKQWIFDSLAFFGLSSSAKAITKSTFDGQVSWNVQYGIHAWYQYCNNPGKRLSAARWLVHMTPEVMGKDLVPYLTYVFMMVLKFPQHRLSLHQLTGILKHIT